MSLENILVPNNLDLYINTAAPVNSTELFSVSKQTGGAQNLSTSITSKILFGDVIVNGGGWDPISNSYTFITSGIYEIIVSVGINASIASGTGNLNIQLQLQKNGVVIQAASNISDYTSSSLQHFDLDILYLGNFVKGDILSIWTLPPSGTGTTSTFQATVQETIFYGKKL